MENQPPPGSEPVDIHKPFTIKENFEQLSNIDKDIASLLKTSAHALESLTRPDLSASDPTDAFKDSMNSFLSTLHSVDVRLKRQIWALEEAGIIKLPDEKQPSASAVAGGAPPPPSLQPDGVGKIGSLDVGWLNSRSNKVERDMEKELWAKAREELEKANGNGNGGQGDAEMKS